MLINFDVNKDLFVFMKQDEEKHRWYYASGDPRIVLRLEGFSIEEIIVNEWCDGLVGWDRGDAGYVLPEYVGAKHSKITLKSHGVKEFAIGTPPADLKMMSAIIADAPRRAIRFDATKIANETISLLTDYAYRLSTRLSIGGWRPGVDAESDFVPLRAEIDDLCRIANGEIDRATASEELIGETQELLQDIAELTAPYWTAFYTIPADWRDTELGRAWDAARYWMISADAITLSEAAMMLYGAADAANLVKIDRLILKQKLSEYIDPAEGNPRRARRVLKREVKALKPNKRR